ncbi:helix-turn-helix domain-containing protein [Candidatus Woesearchaeota archaeon]|nr:helix-turn-helix domain-containing protein [Candidatus Woesearchaeota archaeon]
MVLNTSQKQKLRKFITDLSKIRGRHTELVSVYIPAGFDLNKVTQQLSQEQSTAANIKDKTTRTHVIESIEKMIRHLKLYKKTPENGLAAFSGDISDNPSKTQVEAYSIEPPEQIQTRLYRCDQTFVLDPLKEMMEVKEVYALLVMDKREATLGILKGTRIDVLQHLTSFVPGKFKAGGQCHLYGTTIQFSDGNIKKIEDLKIDDKIKVMNFQTYDLEKSKIIGKWKVKKDKIYKILTKSPRLENECSKDHLFFVLTEDGIIEKPAENLKRGDLLLMPEKIKIKGKKHKLNSKKYYNSFDINKDGQKILRKKRERLNLYQSELAKKINTFQANISSYELGTSRIRRDTLIKLCSALNIDFEYFVNKYTEPYLYSNVKLPTELTPDFAQFLGYFLGDGCIEEDRITFFEQNYEVALKYKEKFDEIFGLKSSYKFRTKKYYHQLRFTTRPLVRLIKKEFFPQSKKTYDAEIPERVLTSNNKVLAGFLNGIFDAEGYINLEGSVGIASVNKYLIQQIQLALLRFSILPSFYEYDNRKNPYSNKPIFKLEISEKQSLELFRKYIGFSSWRKREKLNKLIGKKSATSFVRQILIPGRSIRELVINHGYSLRHFSKLKNFFRNERKMSKIVFKNSILKYINSHELYLKLNKILNYNLLPVQIKDIKIINKKVEMIDIAVKNQNFIANGIITHNSSARFQRLREEAAKEFFVKIGGIVNNELLPIKTNIKGIILGGPGMTKTEFYEADYMNRELKDKVKAIEDITYTDETGLHHLVDKAQSTLAKEHIIEEKKILEKFFQTLAKEERKTAYGYEKVKKALEMGAVATLLISETLEEGKVIELETLAEQMSTEVKIISTDTKEGQQLRDLGKVAAILRYEI